MCAACDGKRYLIVAIDGNEDALRIERCDLCSADTLDDAAAEQLPGAYEALLAAHRKRVLAAQHRSWGSTNENATHHR